MSEVHNILFVIRPQISVEILNKIAASYSMDLDASYCVKKKAIEYIIPMDREETEVFCHEYDWALEEVCDLDQENGGNFVC